MNARSLGNSVTFILDGDNFFPQLLADLQAVAAAPPAPDTYVRLAFWEVEHTLRLGAGYLLPTLLTQLQAIVVAGHRVQVILWQPASIDRYFDPGLAQTVYNVNDATATALRAVGVEVYFEVYQGWVAGTSTHQKIAICSIAGHLRAFVGGMNLARFYWDAQAHPYNNPPGGNVGVDGHTCHDTVVRVEGPATLDIEREWLRRWKKQYFSLLAPVIVEAQAAQNGAMAVANPAAVQVLTTNSESWSGREADIQAELVRRIGAATRYVYIENYGFSDPTIVAALRARLVQRPQLRVIVMFPGQMHQDATFGHMARIAYAKIATANCNSIIVGGEEIFRRDCTAWEISESWNAWSTMRSIQSTVQNRWMENDVLRCTMHGATRDIPLRSITEIRGGARFYAPYRRVGVNLRPIYIHSKLALIDDSVAFVGTANFTYRSMVYDGEISLCIDDAAVVTQMRTTLFQHYGMNFPIDQWDMRAGAFARSAAPGLGVAPIPIHTLRALTDVEIADTTNPAIGRLNFTYY